MNRKMAINGFGAVMLSVLLLAGCGRMPEDASGLPRATVYIQ